MTTDDPRATIRRLFGTKPTPAQPTEPPQTPDAQPTDDTEARRTLARRLFNRN